MLKMKRLVVHWRSKCEIRKWKESMHVYLLEISCDREGDGLGESVWVQRASLNTTTVGMI